MTKRTDGLHHVTAISGAPQANVDFFSGLMGQRLVKKTVNFDDPGTYHLYYGNRTADPGTILTFFPIARAAPGRAGRASRSLRRAARACGGWLRLERSRYSSKTVLASNAAAWPSQAAQSVSQAGAMGTSAGMGQEEPTTKTGERRVRLDDREMEGGGVSGGVMVKWSGGVSGGATVRLGDGVSGGTMVSTESVGGETDQRTPDGMRPAFSSDRPREERAPLILSARPRSGRLDTRAAPARGPSWRSIGPRRGLHLQQHCARKQAPPIVRSGHSPIADPSSSRWTFDGRKKTIDGLFPVHRSSHRSHRRDEVLSTFEGLTVLSLN